MPCIVPVWMYNVYSPIYMSICLSSVLNVNIFLLLGVIIRIINNLWTVILHINNKGFMSNTGEARRKFLLSINHCFLLNISYISATSFSCVTQNHK